MSELQNKSTIFQSSAQELHNKDYFPPVAHCSYYSCYQLMKHIWLHKMKKTQNELDILCSTTKQGSHEALINEIGKFIKQSGKKNCLHNQRDFNSKIGQLKKLRVKADYDDSVFGSSLSKSAIMLSAEVVPILKQYQ